VEHEILVIQKEEIQEGWS